MSKPLIFYIDTLFPKEYFQAVKEGILVWNTAFRKAGIRDALQVKYADSKIIPAEQRAFVSYDLMMPGIKSDFTCHPRTGEILSCRVNIGHGFQKGKLDDYLLSCGASDPRIIAAIKHFECPLHFRNKIHVSRSVNDIAFHSIPDN